MRLKHKAAGQWQQDAVQEDAHAAQRHAACALLLIELGANGGEERDVDGKGQGAGKRLVAEAHLQGRKEGGGATKGVQNRGL